MIATDAFRNVLKDLAGQVRKRCPYASALAMQKKSLSLNIDSKSQTIEEKVYGTGVVFRGFDGELVEELSTNNLDRQSLQREVRNFTESLKMRKSLPLDVKSSVLGKGDFRTPVMIDPATIPLEEKLETLGELKELLLHLDENVRDIKIVYNESRETSAFVDEKNDLAQELIRTELHMVLFAQVDGKTVYESHSCGGTRGYESISVPAEELEKLQDRLRALFRAQPINPGNYAIITSPMTTGIIAHESFGHGVEMDLFLKRNARAKFYMNREISSPLVTMKDDASLPGGYGTYFFDDEGMWARPTTIIESGILRCGLTDLYSAYALKAPRSANGRRESYARKTYARMTNTFIEPQHASLEELLSMAGEGIYLESPMGGIEDPQGWGIQITVKIGREFKKGRFTGKVFSPVAITGYVPELLQSIQGVGSDFMTYPGFCGKGYKEMVRVGIGGPHILARCRLG
jgi:TldD protein